MTDLLKRYEALQQKVERHKTELTRAETRLEDARVRLAETLKEIRSQGFDSISGVRAERERLQSAIDKILCEAERLMQQ